MACGRRHGLAPRLDDRAQRPRLAGAVLARRHDRVHPIALEGFELALVSLSILALIGVFYYLILGPGWS